MREARISGLEQAHWPQRSAFAYFRGDVSQDLILFDSLWFSLVFSCLVFLGFSFISFISFPVCNPIRRQSINNPPPFLTHLHLSILQDKIRLVQEDLETEREFRQRVSHFSPINLQRCKNNPPSSLDLSQNWRKILSHPLVAINYDPISLIPSAQPLLPPLQPNYPPEQPDET